MFVQSEISAGRCVGRPCPFRLPNHPFRLCLAGHSLWPITRSIECAWPITLACPERNLGGPLCWPFLPIQIA
jgi:hypothetical protein